MASEQDFQGKFKTKENICFLLKKTGTIHKLDK